MANVSVEQRVVRAALEARERAYAPYSKFLVGAALVTPSGELFTGCNVENASYGLTVCAERTAVFSAVSAGQKEFALLAVATAGGYAPCGACRQVLAEFAPRLEILLVDSDDPARITRHNLAELLPHTFALERDSAANNEIRMTKE